MFGDAALGETNLAMICTARAVGAAAKFTGSGGAIVALCPQGQQQEKQLQGEHAIGKTLQQAWVL
jgi:glucuronokinase